MLTLIRKPLPELVKTGTGPLDAALETYRNIEIERRAEQDQIVAEVNARGGADDETRKLIEASNKRYDAIEESVRKLAEKINATDVRVSMDPKDQKKFRLANVARAMLAHGDAQDLEPQHGWDKSGAGFEREVLQTARKNHAEQTDMLRAAMGPIIDKSGGILVPSVAISDWIDLLRAALVLPKLGARFITNLQGMEVPIYGLATGVTAAWYAIGDEPAFSAQTYKARFLSPKRLATAVRINKLLLDQASMDVQGMVETDMAAAVARAIELGALFGTGASGQPRGIVYDPDILPFALGANGARFSLRDVPRFEQTFEDANVEITSDAGFLMGPGPKSQLKREGVVMYSGGAISAGMPYVMPAVSDAALESLLGYKFASSTAVPTGLTKGSSTELCTYVIFALWQQLMMGQWGGMQIRMSDVSGNSAAGSAFLRNERWIVLEMLADAMLRQPKAAVVCADALTAEA